MDFFIKTVYAKNEQTHALTDIGQDIGQFVSNIESPNSFKGLLDYFLLFGVGIAVILAVFSIIYAGYMYMSSSDNGAKKEEAKGRIKASLGGLLLALGCVLVLRFVNPNIGTFNIVFPGLNTAEKLEERKWEVGQEESLDRLNVQYVEGVGYVIGGGDVAIDFDGSPGAYRVVEDPNGKFTINGKRYSSAGYERLENARSNDGKWVGVVTQNGQPVINPDGSLTGTLSYGGGRVNGDTTPFVALSNKQISSIKEVNPGFKLGDSVILTNSGNGKSIKALYADNAGNRGDNFSEISPAAAQALDISYTNKGADGKLIISVDR